MKRWIMDDLMAWKNSKRRKPLVFRGARQVGKTWVLEEFGKTFPDGYALQFRQRTGIRPVLSVHEGRPQDSAEPCDGQRLEDHNGHAHHIWQSLPSQFAKENKKFLYSVVKPGARAREYENALNWLKDADIVRKVYRITKPGLPLSAYEDLRAFKIVAVGVGLLRRLSHLSTTAFAEGTVCSQNSKEP